MAENRKRCHGNVPIPILNEISVTTNRERVRVMPKNDGVIPVAGFPCVEGTTKRKTTCN